MDFFVLPVAMFESPDFSIYFSSETGRVEKKLKMNGNHNSALSSNIDRIIEKMVSELKSENPADPIAFMQQYLVEAQRKNLHNSSPNGEEHAESVPRVKLSFDIGGSLCKIAFYDSSSKSQFAEKFRELSELEISFEDVDLSFESKDGHRFHFVKVATSRVEEFLAFLARSHLISGGDVVSATGGGAYKYADALKEKFGVELRKYDEMESLLKGLNFALKNCQNECYTFSDRKDIKNGRKVHVDINQNTVYPYILVNIGSGISIIRVDSHDRFERVSGSFIGGGTYYGLCRLLTNVDNFSELTKLAVEGDPNKLNMTVADIYGGDYEKFNLPGYLIASAFGKSAWKDNPWDGVTAADISVALGIMVCINASLLAYFCAEKYGIKQIFFAGNFLRKNPLSLNVVTYGVDYYSKGNMEALFLEHEGYFGAMGAMMN